MSSASSSQQAPPPPPPEPQTLPPPPAQPPVAMPPFGQMPLPQGFQPYVYAATNAVSYVPQQAFETPKPKPNKAWEIIKMALHILSAALGAAGVGLGFSSLNFTYFTYTVVIATAPPCIIALVWSISELITRVARKLKSGIHPAAHIALCLIIFLVATILTSLFGPWFQSSWGSYDDPSSSSQSCGYRYNATLDTMVYSCTGDSSDDEAAQRVFDHERSVSIAAAVVTYLIAAINFALFVGACVDTSRANTVASRPIYVIAQPQMMQGWQPIPQVPIQYPPAVQQPPARDVAPTESESESESQNKSKNKGKGKEPALNDIVEQNEPSGSQA
ncbi:uncharacterized protein TRIVIDRAFT_54358 [Trichoderma virens Gv29-8]|uniref:Uncharacterized protein n=1 Tax=Hypocrea virens (strain Gv29-8 / FGSC 10586) TaxID=413071 RepID=G9MLN7_HYPVG|nr:uncharacterized protein TRIVIDRAFT_54358 [Trichoderma virens Gv29-8]EHK24264.1 hypothetical protein TRIVIDRAFT_54358 [Trichoderma virens Gv29-8]UKZ54529.1 hypothetical protein TrVGV298_008338 [Trichoderma virens]